MVNREIIKATFRVVSRILSVFFVILSLFAHPKPVYAEPLLTVVPITWNVVGLDSNNVNVGPNTFPVGARVCNTGSLATNVQAEFIWDDGGDLYDKPGSFINLRSDPANDLYSLNKITMDIGAGSVSEPTCVDYYFEVQVTRSSAAYDTARRYHIEISSTESPAEFSTISTPTPREIYVEHLISQNRNSTDKVTYWSSSDPLKEVSPGGTMSLVLGKTYYIQLDASTATQGYNQIEDFINFPNTIFQILSVETTYSANTSGYVTNPNEKLYADACLWDMDPDNYLTTYLSCVGSDGKAGGTVKTIYEVKIIGGVGEVESLNTLIYDFSGSSFHYNSDFSTFGWTLSVSTPLTMTKSFNPASISSSGSSILSIDIGNDSGNNVTGVSVEDTLPSGLSFTAPTISSTCTAGDVATNGTTLSLTNGTVQVGGCKITVGVNSAANGTYVNTTGPLLINSSNTGITASANLIVEDTPSSTCVPITIANWTISDTTRPPLVTTKDGSVTALAYSNGVDQNPNTTWWRITDAATTTSS